MVAACPFPANRGTPSRISGMAEALSGFGHDIHVITYHFGIEKETNGYRIHRTIKLPYNYFGPGPTFFKLGVLDPLLFIKLLKVTRKYDIEVIHAHHFEGALISYAVRKLTGVKVIYDAHTTLHGEMYSYKFPQNKCLIDFLENSFEQQFVNVLCRPMLMESREPDALLDQFATYRAPKVRKWMGEDEL